MTPALKKYIHRCLAAQHLSWAAHCEEVRVLGLAFDALSADDQAAVMSGDLVTEYAESLERKALYRRLTRPGPTSGPNPFYRFWVLRRRIRPLFANTWGGA